MKYYETNRLIIREWINSDIPEYIELNLDTDVLKYFPKLYNRDESIADIKKFQEQLTNYGYTIYACELKLNHCFIGFVGLNNRFDMPFSPCVEVGWRLKKIYWGNGYATEAAEKCLEIAFKEFNIAEVVAFTPKVNLPSIRVMQKIGMINEARDLFHHYKLNKEHKLSLHELYKIDKHRFINYQKLKNVKK